jgi:hypothetical protein
MSLLSDNIIPGNQGRVFRTNAMTKSEMERIKEKLLELEGIEDVVLNFESFPKEFKVQSRRLVRVEDIEEKVKSAGCHAVPSQDLGV